MTVFVYELQTQSYGHIGFKPKAPSNRVHIKGNFQYYPFVSYFLSSKLYSNMDKMMSKAL